MSARWGVLLMLDDVLGKVETDFNHPFFHLPRIPFRNLSQYLVR